MSFTTWRCTQCGEFASEDDFPNIDHTRLPVLCRYHMLEEDVDRARGFRRRHRTTEDD